MLQTGRGSSLAQGAVLQEVAQIGMTPIPDICLFFTQTRFLENKIYTEERVNYDKRISRQNSVNRDLLGQANIKIKITQSLSHTVCKTTHRV